MKKLAKQDSSIVREYVRRLSDDDVSLVVERLTQPVCGDRANICLIFERDKEIDKWLSSAKGWEDWFDKVDLIEELAIIELSRRQKNKDKKEKK